MSLCMDGITGTTVAATIVAVIPAVFIDAVAITTGITGIIGTTVVAATDVATGGRDH